MIAGKINLLGIPWNGFRGSAESIFTSSTSLPLSSGLTDYWYIPNATYSSASQFLESSYNGHRLDTYGSYPYFQDDGYNIILSTHASFEFLSGAYPTNSSAGCTFNMWVAVGSDDVNFKIICTFGSNNYVNLFLTGSFAGDAVFEGTSGNLSLLFPVDGSFTMVTISVSSAGIASCYINAVFKGIVSSGLPDASLYIGGDGGGDTCAGYYSDFAIWNRPLSQADITAIYNSYPLQTLI